MNVLAAILAVSFFPTAGGELWGERRNFGGAEWQVPHSRLVVQANAVSVDGSFAPELGLGLRLYDLAGEDTTPYFACLEQAVVLSVSPRERRAALTFWAFRTVGLSVIASDAGARFALQLDAGKAGWLLLSTMGMPPAPFVP